MTNSTNSDAELQIQLWEELQRTPAIFEKLSQSQRTGLGLQKELREEFSADLVRTAITLHELRQKAADKFSNAQTMWFDRTGLEQSTPEAVAIYKAKRFKALIQDAEIHDYCTGIGADAIALAARGPVQTYDLGAHHAWQAKQNAIAYQVEKNVSTNIADVTTLDQTGKIVHLDPDRRSSKSGSRTLRLEQYAPDLEFMQQLIRTARGGAIKLSPASNFYGKFPGTELELINLNRECKEATIWFGELAEPNLHRATLLPENVTLAGNPLAAMPFIEDLKKYIYDPDPAVVRASLIDLLSNELDIARLDEEEEYLTADELIETPFVQPFEVVDVLPNNLKVLKKYFQQHPASQLEIKSRHLPVEATAIRKRLKLTGTKPVTLIFARLQKKAHILVCKRP